MTPATIIREARADGVTLALSPAGTIKATGNSAAVNRWLAVIREHKAGIIEALKAAGDTDQPSSWWRIHYADRDPVEVACYPEATHADILARAEELREHFEERAAILEHEGGLPIAEAEEQARRATGLLARNKGAPWAALREALGDPSLPDTTAPVDHPPYGLPEWCMAPDQKTAIRQGAFRLEKPT